MHDYLGIAGPSPNKKNPTTEERYSPQQGILLGVKGLPNAGTKLMPPVIRFASIEDGTTHTMMVTECTGRGTEKEDDDPNGAWISGKNITHLDSGVNRKGPKSSWNDELIFQSTVVVPMRFMQTEPSTSFLKTLRKMSFSLIAREMAAKSFPNSRPSNDGHS